ncbi:hypothetical protein ISF6_3772 [Piscinibacter sakaiensis]|uniref:Lipoprotein n=1 Tax=Piscinibacter sakaiensis TaxID=1547922 RepID=A0A0K8P5D7_PISS1|nr:hypothetical protein ISF6_3772 [Piscinibacter sakaiensis]
MLLRCFLRSLGPCLLVLSLAGCGGGGGGGGAADPGGAGTGGGVASATGLVPAAPSTGATLQRDASVLRPARAGHVWTYAGTAVYGTGATPVAYETVTSHAAAASGFDERSTNPTNGGADAVTLLVDGGTVRTVERVDFAGKGVLETLSVLELRSPVVQGDQYTIVDRRYTDTAIDADRDGRPDALDVAAYARVVGRETVSLPDLPVLQAVRVDTTVLTRIRTSSDGQFSAVQASILQAWYVEGIGIVRRRLQAPGVPASQTEVFDERLLRWDGQTVGFGVMPEVPAIVPASAGPLAGLPITGLFGNSVKASIAFDEHALVFVVRESTVAGESQSMFVSRMDRRGQITAAQELPILPSADSKFLRHGNEVVGIEVTSSTQVSEARMTRFSADGALIDTPWSTRLDLGGLRASRTETRLVDAASDGSALWLLWTRSQPFDAAVGRQLLLRAFRSDGTPLTPETVIIGNGDVFPPPALSARAGRALVTWSEGLDTGRYDRYYGFASLAGEAFDRRLLVSGGLRPSTPASVITPLALAQGDALLWGARLAEDGPALPSAAGLRLDATGSPVRSAAASLDAELLAGMPTPYRAEAAGNRLVLAKIGGGKVTVAWLDAGTTALADSPVRSLAAPGTGFLGGSLPSAMLTWPDRVIVFSPSESRTIPLTTQVYWLNAGNPP